MEEQSPVSNNPETTEPVIETLPPPQTDVTTQPIVAATVTTKRKVSKKVLVIVSVVLLSIAAVAVYFFVLKKDKTPATPQTNNNTEQAAVGTATNFAPRFSTVDAIADFEGAKWYATTGAVIKTTNNDSTAAFYSNTQGVPIGTPNSLVVHNGQLWVSTLDGVAVYNKTSDAFIPVKDGLQGTLQNGKLFYDAAAKKLYLNDFTSFYGYNDQTKKFEAITGPTNAQSFAANDGFIALFSSANPDWPIWVLNKSTGKWAKNTPSLEEQSYRVANISGKIVIIGRPTGYISCEQAGKIPGTTAYYLNDKGVWTAFTTFNSDKKRPELTLLASVSGQAPTVRTQSCDGNGTEKLYDLTITGNELKLTNEKTTKDLGTFNNPVEQASLVATLTKATKLHPATAVAAIDGAGNVIYKFSDEISQNSSASYTGIAIAKQNVLSDATIIDISSLKTNHIVPILCGMGKDKKLTYLFSGEEHITVGGQEGFPDGSWASAKLYTVTGDKIAEYKDLGVDVAAPEFSCTSKDIVWLGTTGLNKMDRDTKAIGKIGAAVGKGLLYSNTTVQVAPNGSLWFGVIGTTPKSSTLYFYDSTKGSYTQVAAKTTLTNISAVSDNNAVLYNVLDKDPTTTVVDLAGKVLQTLPADNAAVVNGASNDEFVMLQLTDADQSIFKDFTTAKIKVGSAATKLETKNSAYTAWYTSGGNTGFGLSMYPMSIYDAGRNQFWLNDDILGVNAIQLP